MADRPLALITGASSGIGLALAHTFADHQFDLIITADEDLEPAAAALRAGGAKVRAIQSDLSSAAGVESLLASIGQTDADVDVLALNAGIGAGGSFIDIPLRDEQRVLGLNIEAPVHLAKHFAPLMARRRAGRILITTSVAATMPGPYYATYAASKAFLLSFAGALRYELKDQGVVVTALLPGPTDTRFFERSKMLDTPVQHIRKDDPNRVAEQAYRGLMKGAHQVVAGSAKNRAQTVASRLLPESVRAAAHARMTRPSKRPSA